MKPLSDAMAPEWMQRAACAQIGGDLWFPEKGANGTILARVRDLCAGCPVQSQCLEHALAIEDWNGIWGGLTPKQRRKLVRDREAA